MANAGLFIVGLIMVVFGLFASVAGLVIVPLGVILLALSAIELLNQWERGVVFTLGKYVYTMEPGLNFAVPIVQNVIRTDMRIQTIDVEKQETMTKDNVPALVNAVVYFKVKKPDDVVIKIDNYAFAVAQLTQAALRDVIGNNDLDSVLTQRDKLAKAIQEAVDKDTDAWGIDIQAINIQEIELPAEMKRAMAKQAESERERRAMIIKSEGERAASKNLSEAAAMLARAPGALHLRTLQTISDIAADPSEKIVIVLPTDFAGTAAQLISGKK